VQVSCHSGRLINAVQLRRNASHAGKISSSVQPVRELHSVALSVAMGGCEVADSGDFSEVAGTIGTAVQALTSNSVMPIKLNWFFIGLWLKSHLVNIK
jgi:hypothetical protein